MIIDGKKIAEEILEKLKEKRKNYDKLKIAAFLIGKDKEKLSFLKIKQKFAQELNIEFKIYEIDENLSKRKIRKYLSQILKHKTIQGAIFQLPIPEKFPIQYLLNSIPPKKDIACLSSRLLGKFYTNIPVIRPPAVEVVDFIKEKYNLDFQGKNVLIVGYGRLVGKPLVHYFANLDATVIIAQSKTDLKEYLKIADVIVTEAGKANLIQDCRDGAILIDFGYSFENGLCQILVAKLFENFFKLLETKIVI